MGDQTGGGWDLDLWVTDPSGEVIKYNNKESESGGELDVDKREWHDDPVENVIWRKNAPKGEYLVRVHTFGHPSSRYSKNYKVVIMHHGEQEVLQKTMEVTEGSDDSLQDAVVVKRFTN